jgi:sugar diacid utilization regulator
VLLAELLDIPGLGLIPVVPGADPDRPVCGVYTTDLPEPGGFLDGGELVLTSATWYRGPLDAEIYVRALADADCAALVAGTAAVGRLPAALSEACRRHGVALFTVGDDVSFATITGTVLAALAGPGGRSPGADLHRRLLAALASGAGPEGLVELLGRTTGLGCALLSATGRPTAGHLSGVPADQLDRAHRAALAAGTFPTVQPMPGGGGRKVSFHSIHPIQPPVARRPPVAYLAAGGDHRDWAPGIADAVVEVCALLAMEQARGQERRRIEERLLRGSLELVRDGNAAEAEGRLRTLGLHFPLTSVVVGTRDATYGAELGAVVLDDVADQLPGCSAPIAEGSTYLMLMPVGGEDEHHTSALIRESAERLRPLLAPGWIAIGTGHPALGAAALGTSLDEARHAHRVAALNSGTVRVATSDELSSHLLLLASVPEEVRRLYRNRLIGVLETYDREHGSDLVGTLAAFLDASGSWNRCAEQLHIHVNTLRYRLQRIEQLTGHSLATLHDRVDFCLALNIR